MSLHRHRGAARRLIGASVVLYLAVPSATLAQTGTTEPTDSATVLQEVVVIARKRAEDLQDTPIAVTAFSAESIERRGFNNLADIAQATPSLVFIQSAGPSGSSSAAAVFLRGIGQLDFAMFTDPGVGIYLDGVYIARSVGSVLNFVDIDHVEVLRGPQGTLFGRNTIGGAINVVTRRPTDKMGGDASVTLGSRDRAMVKGSVSLPFSDTLGADFSGYVHRRDGHVRNPETGRQFGDDDVAGGRLQLQWRVGSNLTALLAMDATRQRESSAPNEMISSSGTGYLNSQGVKRPPGGGNTTAAYAFNSRLGGICTTSPDSTRACYGAAWQPDRPRLNYATGPNGSDIDIRGAALTVDWDAVTSLAVKSVTSWRKLDSDYAIDIDNTPFDLAATEWNDEQWQLSQELQLSGVAAAERLNWLLGLYYFKEDGEEHFYNFNSGSASSDGLIYLKTEDYAAFGEVTWSFTPRLHLSAGVRFTDERKQFRTDTFVVAPAPAPLVGLRLVADNSRQTESFNELTPRATFSADLTDALMTYITYSRGFKSGGYNGRYATANVNGSFVTFDAPVPFDPEYVRLYEAGLKFSTRRFRVNTALFTSEYSDIQVTFRPNLLLPLNVIGNAAEARIRGVETEFTLLPLAGLQLEGGLSYLDAKYTRLDSRAQGITLATHLAETPEWTGNLSASYAVSLPNGSMLTPRVDWSYKSKIYHDALNSTPVIQPAYDVLNASLAWDTAEDRWRLTAGVTNLTNERYLAQAAFSPSSGVALGVYGRPREWFASVRRAF